MNGKISNFAQLASLRRYTLSEGRGKGLDIIDCDNGKIRFLVNLTKAMDIPQLWHEGQNMSFLSKNAPEARGIDFLRRFEGGMLYTCGLDSVGGREGFELHGNLHNTPAELIHAECNENGIVIEGVMRDTALFGQNLVLYRQISSDIGSDTVTVKDTLINEGFADEPYCLLYHVNVGYPMLDSGARIEAEELSCEERTPFAKEHIGNRHSMTDDVVGQEETCYFLKLKQPTISLVNEKIGKRFTLSYSGDTLPAFVEWKSMASGDYALGLEPATTELDDRFSYRTLGKKESIEFSLSIKVSKI